MVISSLFLLQYYFTDFGRKNQFFPFGISIYGMAMTFSP